MADDLLTALLLARTAPVLLAPAMNDEMFANPATQANLGTLRSRGFSTVGPEVGALAEGPSDKPGRMSEPETIIAHAARLLGSGSPLANKRIVVTAGPTREPIDPVRVVSNRSSGKMGYRIAEAAWGGSTRRSGERTHHAPAPTGVLMRLVDTTAQLDAVVREELPTADVLIMAAAPADYRPKDPGEHKRPRATGKLAVELEPTEDILSGTVSLRRPQSVIVGFALETGDADAKGAEKLRRKNLDLIVINDGPRAGSGVRRGYQPGHDPGQGWWTQGHSPRRQTRSRGGHPRRGGGTPWQVSENSISGSRLSWADRKCT